MLTGDTAAMEKQARVHSCIYKGEISHRRFTPKPNRFRYRLHMFYLDLEELPELFDHHLLWSARGTAIAEFRRADHAGDPSRDLATHVRDLVQEHAGVRPVGRIGLLTHLRYFGYCFNPISVYYCHDDKGELCNTVLEVSNTPWKERHCYVLDSHGDAVRRYEFDKAFHVSPFMDMNMRYRCKLRPPGNELLFALENWRDGRKLFDAHLKLTREPITSASLRRCLIRDPLMTLRVTSLIHWQAIRLWLKGTPFFAHPAKRARRETGHI